MSPFCMLVANAGATFVPRMLSSYTPTYPNGKLERRMVLSWFGVTEDPVTKKLTARSGYERIPDNWYRRRHNMPDYGVVLFARDLVDLAAENPDVIRIGGNTGTVNSFAGVNLGDLTGGVYNALALTDPSKLVCFVFQLSIAVLPDALQGGLLGGVLGLATDLLTMIVKPLMDPNCPGITQLQMNLLDGFPGAGLGRAPRDEAPVESGAAGSE